MSNFFNHSSWEKIVGFCSLLALIMCVGCVVNNSNTKSGSMTAEKIELSRASYRDSLYGFWLGQCIANWTGLVTEMDKVGNIGSIKTGNFYTRDDWGKKDLPSIWGQGIPSDLSSTIDFVTVDEKGLWGADDDTDIEYIYLDLLNQSESVKLTPEQIRDAWLNHIYSAHEKTPFGRDSEGNYENFLWVSNQKAMDLMAEGILPPATGSKALNPHYDMIDAQLTTEIFGFFAPARPDIALALSDLAVRTVADKEAADIARFYIVIYSLASAVDRGLSPKEQVFWLADRARQYLSQDQYPAAMFDFVKRQYQSGATWEQARDAIYDRYQVEQQDGYDLTSRNLYCNGCFAAGINFASSLVSLFYGEGDFKKTIKIGALAGWDSDNPTATWGGLLGFLHGKQGIEKTFGKKFSNQFNIHRTRKNFPNNGIDTFDNMANKGVAIVDKVISQMFMGKVDLKNDTWQIEPALNHYKVMSFNIRTAKANDPDEKNWEKRKPLLLKVLHQQMLDFLGLQEATEAQHAAIIGSLGPDWESSEFRQIIFKKNKFQIINSGLIHLIEDKWEPRSAEWLHVRDKISGQEFIFANTHWGVDEISQQGSADIMVKELREPTHHWTLPIILLGDFNMLPQSSPYTTLKKQSPLMSMFEGLTFTGFKEKADVQLDYVWVHRFFKTACSELVFPKSTPYISDHYPVVCDLSI
jgi:endonuclease/exonuclease/phosphatase family metal-dependent hydrolase